MRTAGWRAAACGAALVGAVHFTAGDPVVREAAWTLLVLGAFTAVVIGVRWHRPAARGPWLALAAALGLLTLANLLNFPQRAEPAGLLLAAQLLELVAFPLFGVAALSMVRRQTPWGDWEGAIDGAIVMVALSTLLSGTVFTPEAMAATTPIGLALLVVAPVMLAGVTAAAVRLLFIGTRVPATRFVVGSSVCALVGHVLRTHLQSAGTYERGDWTDVFIWAAYTCAGLAALHPTMPHLTTPSEQGDGRITRGRLALLGVSLLTPPTTILLKGAAGVLPLVASLAVSALVLWRLWRLVLDHQAMRDELRHQAKHDALTGLPNRVQVMDRLHHALRVAGPHTSTAVLFLDLDGFKLVNDDYGHRVGDDALVAVVDRLQDLRRAEDLLGRLAGDEFVLVCTQVHEPDVTAIAERVISAFEAPFMVGDLALTLGTSVGVALHAGPDGDAEQLLGEADAAMYFAKQRSGSHHERYDDVLGAQLHRKRSLERDLARTVRAGELDLVFQPIVGLRESNGGLCHAIEGTVSLLRWEHPELGRIEHDEILRVAAATGIIVSIGRWAFRAACEQLERWRCDGAIEDGFRMHATVVPQQLLDAGLPEELIAICAATGTAPSELVIEVSEHALLDERGEAIRTARALRDRGFAIALDGLGGGHTSFAHLKRLPVDLITIDATSVPELTHSGDDQVIVQALVSIARQLGIQVIGAGVESAEQGALLHQLGCDFGLGAYFGSPRPPATLQRRPLAEGPPGPDLPLHISAGAG
jgi:diguanylate cyclase